MLDPKENLEKHKRLLLKKVEESNKVDSDIILKAMEFGEKAHEGQNRKTGDKYFIHPIRVALKAIEYDLDSSTIISSLLHDVIEDTEDEQKKRRLDIEIRRLFGETVSKLVNALTKVIENQKLTLYKIFQMGRIDSRVILIKLLDRLDNLSDLNYLSRVKQRRICSETTAIYAEVAQGLGLIEIEEELRDRVFRILYPYSYKKTYEKLKRFKDERKQAIYQIIDQIQAITPPNLVLSITPQYFKPQEFLLNRQEIVRILNAIVIETSSQLNCYYVLGSIHTNFRSVPQNINDYISNPKANGWRGLSTKVIINGERINIIIVTKEFQEKNRKGVLTLINEGIYQSENYQEFLHLYLEVASEDARIDDVFRFSKSKTIQTMTPAGDIIELRYGATILDFAFCVHTELGLKCSGGLIEGVRYPRDKILEDGMTVKILTSDAVITEKEWINDVVMPKSRKEILKYLDLEKSKKPATEVSRKLMPPPSPS